MASSKIIFFFFSASAAVLLSSTTQCRANVSDIDPLTCMEMLMPCQSFMSGSSTPDDQCCGPLKRMALMQNRCVCRIFNDVNFIASVNATKEQASGLLERCGGDPGIPDCCTKTIKSAPVLYLASAPSPNPTTSRGSRNMNLDLGRSLSSVLIGMLMVPGIFLVVAF